MIHHGLLPRFRNLSLSFAGVLTLTITLVICVPLSGQTVYDGNTNLPPFGSFSGSDFDIVSLQNGNLHISIPILTVPQRGGSATYRYVYDTLSSTFQQVKIGQNQYHTFVSIGTYRGWQLASPSNWLLESTSASLKCGDGTGYGITTYTAVSDPAGTPHPVAVSKITSGPACVSQQPSGYSFDGSGIFLDVTQATPRIVLKDGTTIISGSLEDPNGNEQSSTADTLQRNPLVVTNAPIVTYTSPLGQTARGPQFTTWQYTDSNGVQQTWRLDYAAVDEHTNYCGVIPNCSEGTGAFLQPIKLTLPNQLSYQFVWVNNSLEQLQEIILPTGGSISYTYTSACQAPPGGGITQKDCRATVASRTVTTGGTSATWTYHTNGTAGQMVVTDPYSNDEVHTFAQVPGNFNPSLQQVETEVDSWQGSSVSGNGGSLLRKVVKSYVADYRPGATLQPANARPIRVDTTLENGLVRSQEIDYETFTATYEGGNYTVTSLNPSAIREYDYGSGSRGALMRQTTHSYLHTGNSAYLSRNILDRVLQTATYDGSNNQLAMTFNEYDNYSHTLNGQTLSMQASGAVQHDTNYSTSFTTRGNVTAVEQWRKSDGKLLTTVHQYDDAGNIISSVDPLLNQTSYDFTDSWANGTCAPSGQGKAYPTKVTNALNQSTTHSYNSCTGSLAATTDPNLRATSLSYDLLGRMTQTTLPDGGLITNCFSDVSGTSCYNANFPLSVIRTEKVTGGLNKVSTSIVDGLGRVSETQLNSDPDGVTYVDTAYNLVNKVCSVSNPHRSGASPTDGITQYQYDALGRATQVAPPDGTAPTSGSTCPSPGTSCGANNVCTSYAGNTTTVTDQAGRSRKRQVDGLGRLTFVWEDPASLNYETDYVYDGLDNLTSVTQKGGAAQASWRVRSFQYDSLSHLTSASNPESGTISYSYDDDGNLKTKIAPQANQTGTATTTTTYCYDILNRLATKTYSAVTCPATAPSVTFFYDQASYNGLTVTNGIGRRTGMSDSSGTTAWSYDPVGRALTERRTINGTSAITNNTVYSYNLDGSLATLTYPGSGRIITYTLASSGSNTAGRAGSAKDVANSINYATAAIYAPHGDLAQITNGSSINQAFSFNSRLQPVQIYVTTGTISPTTLTQLQSPSCPTTTATIMSRAYSFGLGASDNGNVLSIINCRDTTRSQNFDYDRLNRIADAFTTGNSNWGETYTIDPWGNLTNIAAYPNKTNHELLNAAPASVGNQLAGFTYDAAGNLTNTSTYAYDAENRLSAIGTYTYVYDGDGQRVKKCSNAGCTAGTLYWRSTAGDPIVETGVSGAGTEEYVFFGGKRIARKDVSGGAVHYYFSDHLGSHSMVESATGTTCEQDIDYYPYGGAEHDYCPSVAQNYKFTGKERDAESGLDNFNARYYGSSSGRFITPDWAANPTTVPYAVFGDPQSLNLYSYVQNNPLAKADGNGHCGDGPAGLCQIVMYVAAHVAEVGLGIQATRQEYNAKVRAQTSPAGRDAVKLEMRDKGPALGRELAKEAAQDPARTAARAAKTDAQLAESITRTSPSANATAEAFGTAGKVAGTVAIGIAIYETATAPQGQKTETAAKEAGGLGGALAGGELGAEVGATAGGPYGAAAGGILGSLFGGFGGRMTMDKILNDSAPPLGTIDKAIK